MDKSDSPAVIAIPGPALASLTDLRARHSALLQRLHADGEKPVRPGEMLGFLTAASEMGATLTDPDDRETAQGILDFWTATLLSQVPKASESARPFILQEYDAGSALGLVAKAASAQENAEQVAQTANAFVDRLNREQRDFLERILKQMFRLKVGSLDAYSVPISAEDSVFTATNAQLKFTAKEAKQVLASVIRAGAVLERQADPAKEYVLAYEQLLKSWKFLRDLVSERKAFREMARGWDGSGRKPGALLHYGPELKKCGTYSGRDAMEEAFLTESTSRSVSFVWKLLSAAAIALLVTVVLSFFLWRANQALERRNDGGQAVRASELALRYSGDQFLPVDISTDFVFSQLVALNALPPRQALAPPMALAVLRFSSQHDIRDFVGKPVSPASGIPSQPQGPQPEPELEFDRKREIHRQIGEIGRYLPALSSPDKRWLVTLESGRDATDLQPVVWDAELLNERVSELPATTREINALSFDTETNELIAESPNSNVLIVWDLKKKTMTEFANKTFRDRPGVDPTRVQRTPEKKYYPYGTVRDAWVWQSLTAMRRFTPKERGVLAPGLRKSPIVENVLKAFEHGKSNENKAVDELLNALRPFVGEERADAIQAVAWRLLYEANQLPPSAPAEALRDKARSLLAQTGGGRQKPELEMNLPFFKLFNHAMEAAQAPQVSEATTTGILESFRKAKTLAERVDAGLWLDSTKGWVSQKSQEPSPEEVLKGIRFFTAFRPGMEAARAGDPVRAVPAFAAARAISPELWAENVEPWRVPSSVEPQDLAETVSFRAPYIEGLELLARKREADALTRFEEARRRSRNLKLWNENLPPPLQPGATAKEVVATLSKPTPPPSSQGTVLPP